VRCEHLAFLHLVVFLVRVVALRQLLVGRNRLLDRASEGLLEPLEAIEIDLAILPLDQVPVRFATRILYQEDFVAVFREGHPLAAEPNLENCGLRHLLVSETAHRNFILVGSIFRRIP
jgi:DNA-binding transcriptional LysR family regulator